MWFVEQSHTNVAQRLVSVAEIVYGEITHYTRQFGSIIPFDTDICKGKTAKPLKVKNIFENT